MKIKELAQLVVSLIGVYSIYSAIIIAGMPMLFIATSLFTETPLGDTMATMGLSLTQFVIPFGFGLFLVFRSNHVTCWMLRSAGITETSELSVSIDKEFISLISFGALGLYIIATTLPNALQLLAAWFFFSASQPTSISFGTDPSFWDGRGHEVVYHVSAVGFGFLIFMKSKSITRFIAAIRR